MEEIDKMRYFRTITLQGGQNKRRREIDSNGELKLDIVGLPKSCVVIIGERRDKLTELPVTIKSLFVNYAIISNFFNFFFNRWYLVNQSFKLKFDSNCYRFNTHAKHF